MNSRLVRAAVAAALLLAVTAVVSPRLAAAPATAPGAGELSLDTSAVAAIVRAGIPGPTPITIPGAGQATVVIDPPQTVAFRRGGLEARIGVSVPELGFAGRLSLRYEPTIDAEHGQVQLRPVVGRPEGPLAILPDLSAFLPVVSVPRGFDSVLHPRGGSPTAISVQVQGVEITDERLVVKLGLETRAAR